jgi:hypothetical protein
VSWPRVSVCAVVAQAEQGGGGVAQESGCAAGECGWWWWRCRGERREGGLGFG